MSGKSGKSKVFCLRIDNALGCDFVRTHTNTQIYRQTFGNNFHWMVSSVFSLFSGWFCWLVNNTHAQMRRWQIHHKDMVHHNPLWWPSPRMIRLQYLHGFVLNALMRTKTTSGAWARIAIPWCRAECLTPLNLPALPWIEPLLPPRVGVGRGRHQRGPPSSTRVSAACGKDKCCCKFYDTFSSESWCWTSPISSSPSPLIISCPHWGASSGSLFSFSWWLIFQRQWFYAFKQSRCSVGWQGFGE